MSTSTFALFCIIIDWIEPTDKLILGIRISFERRLLVTGEWFLQYL
jgi:hypothetical protein